MYKGGSITMFNNLSALGYGLVTFAIIIGVGTIVLSKFGDSVGGTANTTVQYLNTQLGTSGLAGWTPAIIALSVGMLFLGVFLNKSGRSI
jgi:predicted anti-sigma-YlaC factor YlaD